MSENAKEDFLITMARIEENLSILEMAKLHMDHRAVIVITKRIEELQDLINHHHRR